MDTSRFIKQKEKLERVLSEIEKYEDSDNCLKEYKENLELDIKAMNLYITLADTWNKQVGETIQINKHIHASFDEMRGVTFSLEGQASADYYEYVDDSLSEEFIFSDSLMKRVLKPFNTHITCFNEMLQSIYYHRHVIYATYYGIDSMNEMLCEVISFLKSDSLKYINPAIEAYIEGIIKTEKENQE